jgi:ParB family transcriptional regulator, chromosome partitioning protein
MQTKSRLGRGLAALLRETASDKVSSDEIKGSTNLPIEYISSNTRNPRKLFDISEIEALSNSIKLRGLLQPILVRRISGISNQYEIVAGERRWRAAQIANLHEVPAIIVDVDESEALEIALVENIQRTNLSPLEEANGFHTLIDQHGYTQEEVAQIVGKSRSHVANTLRLLALTDYTKSLLESGALTPGHARALITQANPDKLADAIVSKGLTVREVEKLTTRRRVMNEGQLNADNNRYPDLAAWERKLSQALGTSVRLLKLRTKYEIKISFQELEQLDDLCRRIVDHSKI